MNKGKIILLNGASSSEKTTISHALRGVLSDLNYIVQLDDFLEMLPNQSRQVTEEMVFQASINLNTTVKYLSDMGKNSIIDHVITSKCIFEAFAEIFKNYHVLTVKITCPIYETLKREKARGDRVSWDTESSAPYIYPDEIYDIIIDTYANSPEECAMNIAGLIKSNNKPSAMKKACFLTKSKLTQYEICAIIEDGLVDYLKTISQNGNRPFVLNEKIGWIKTFPTSWSNYIFYSNFDIKDVDNQILQVISRIETEELPDEWVIGPKSKPINLCDYLEKNNFVKQYNMAGMAIDIMEMDTSVEIPKNVNIIAIENEPMIKLWADVVSNGLWNGNAFESCLFENLIHNPKFKFYLAFLNGEPVASSMLQLSNGIASIDMVSTLQKYWHMGIGTAMTKIPLLYARDKGCKIGVLQASEAGEHGYRKIGFEEFFRFNVYKYQRKSI
jgi:chloramphenicol 3-O-phosphotransferase